MNAEKRPGDLSLQTELDACPPAAAAAAPPLSADPDVDASYTETPERRLALSVVLC